MLVFLLTEHQGERSHFYLTEALALDKSPPCTRRSPSTDRRRTGLCDQPPAAEGDAKTGGRNVAFRPEARAVLADLHRKDGIH